MIRTVDVKWLGKPSYLRRLSLDDPLLSLPIKCLERPVHGIVVAPGEM
jgi:hypothetical protein